jgi:hypothetical protein
MCIIGPKAYNGQHQYIERHLQTHDLRQENGQPGKKRRRQSFCTAAIRTFCLFKDLSLFKVFHLYTGN